MVLIFAEIYQSFVQIDRVLRTSTIVTVNSFKESFYARITLSFRASSVSQTENVWNQTI